VRNIGPGIAAVGRFEEAAAGAAAIEVVGIAAHLPEAGVEHARIGRVHGEIDRAGVGTAREDLLPGGAAVGGAIDAAHFVRPPEMAERGDVHDVGILGMDAHRADGLAILQPDIAPRLAAVDGFVDAVAVGGIAAHAGFAHAHVDHVGVGIGHRDGAHGTGLELAVGDRQPGAAAVGGLPDAAAHAAEVVDVGLRGNAGDGDHAASAERSHQAEAERLRKVGRLRAERAREGPAKGPGEEAS
jgi:hypothetical protein